MNDWYDAEQRAERSQQLSESQRWEEALEEIDAALEINPSNPSWLAYRGYLLDNLDRLEEAIQAYTSALELQPDDLDILTALGADLTRVGRHSRALTMFERVASLDPNCESAYCHRILNYSELGNHSAAEEMFYLAQQLREDCPDCFFHMGISLAAREQYERAIYCWHRALEIEPNYAGVKQYIARAHRTAGDLSQARDFYLAEFRDDPGNTELLMEMGELAVEAGDLSAAAGRFRQVLELDPNHQSAAMVLAEVLLRTGDAKDALNLLVGLAEDGWSSPRLDERLGEANLALGRYQEARAYLESAVEGAPDSEHALMLMGTCLLHLGRPDQAWDVFTRMLAIDANSPYTHHNLAVCCFVSDNPERGLTHCRRAIELKPDYAPAIFKAAIACLELGRWREAREMISRGLALNADDPALRHLSKRLWRYRCRRFLRRLIRFPRTWFGR